MRAHLLHGPILLFIWEFTPISLAQDSLGNHRIAFGYGAGQFEHRTLSCSGAVLTANPTRYQEVGSQVDLWSRHARFTLYGGRHFGDQFYDGLFGGAAVAWEGQYVGLGTGVSAVSGSDGFTGPSFYLRFGNMDRAHFLLDVLPPTPVRGMAGLAWAGVGFNRGHLRGPSGRLGVDVPLHADQAYLLGFSGEWLLPVTRTADVTLQGRWAPSERHANWGTGVGVRFTFED